MPGFELRKAIVSDAEILLKWRNDPTTRIASHSTAIVTMENHVQWLEGVMANENRELFIAEEAGSPVGTVRADKSGGEWELSWTTAPEVRGRGIAKTMVSILANRIADPVRAEIKAGNSASISIAKHVGMRLVDERCGVLYFRRGPILPSTTLTKSSL